MENPFANVTPPSRDVNSPRPPLTREGSGARSEILPSIREGGRRPDEFTFVGLSNQKTYETRRADLRPAVRKYADKLHDEILGTCAKYGADSLKALYAKLGSGAVRIPKNETESINRTMDALREVLDTKELPPGQRELPPLEAFEECIAWIEKQTGEKVTGLEEWDEYELIKGKMNGSVQVGGGWLPVIGGELVREIQGEEIQGCVGARNVDGKLNGEILIGGRILPVIGGELITEVQGGKINGCSDVRNMDGKMNGIVKIEGKWLPVIGGELMESFNGKCIFECSDVQNIGGRLNGRVHCGIRWMPVIGGEPITEIQGLEIENCADVRNVEGKLNGKVKVGGVWLPVIGGELITELGEEIEDCENVRNIDGKLNGIVMMSGHKLPVIEGEVIEHLGGEIIFCSDVHNVGGKLNGMIRIVLPDESTKDCKVVLGKIVE